VANLHRVAQGRIHRTLTLDANPLDDIQHTDDIDAVMLNGRLYDAETMNETGGRARKKYYWE
jgi:hypothetical protein